MNKDINMLLASQSPLAFVFIETSQKNLVLKKLMLTLSNSVKAECVHNLQASESMTNKCGTNALPPSFWLLYNQRVFMQVCESALIMSSNKVILLKQVRDKHCKSVSSTIHNMALIKQK